MSFQQGLSGLNAASKQLEAIGNNVANSNTVGFKSSAAEFADVFASSLSGGGGGSTQVGIGVAVSQVAQAFTQGNVSSSNNPLDLAINGGGFFRVSTGGSVAYSRNGQFSLDKNGYVVNANGARLTGYTANVNGVLSTGKPNDLNMNTSDLAPKQTGVINAVLNLDSNKPPINSTLKPFSLTDPSTYSNSTSVAVFDSLGVSHVLQTYYVKTGPTPATAATAPNGTWDIYAAADDVLVPVPTTTPATPPGKVGTLSFLPDGSIDPVNSIPAAPATTPVTINVTSGAATPFSVGIDYVGTTQYGSTFSVNTLKQDGFSSGRLSGFNIGADGVITGRYTNGQSTTLGQVVLANFTDVNGLKPLGNNLWAESSASGPALVSTPNSGSLGVLQSSAVEDSNVDLTAELVNMITAQRYYQANAQTIKTQDQVLQTLVNLR
ncbi:MAG: flagellar hook protein FlgE [Herminiimonas sp.]|nr:flagellar hook protein FlgE [Herminiimonas sp.]